MLLFLEFAAAEDAVVDAVATAASEVVKQEKQMQVLSSLGLCVVALS